MDVSEKVRKPSSSDTNSVEASSDDGAGDTKTPKEIQREEIQTDDFRAVGTQQKSGPDMTDTKPVEQQDTATGQTDEESLLGAVKDQEIGVSKDNPDIIVHKEKASAASPKDNPPAGVDPSRDTASGCHLEVHGRRDSPPGVNHDLSEHDQPLQAGWDSSVRERRDSLEESRSYSTEDETSDWETPVDVELELSPVCQKSSKASWSTVKVLTKMMPMIHSSVPWSQLAGHKGSFLAGPDKTVLKLRDPCEEKNLTKLKDEQPGTLYRRFIPQYHGTVNKNGKDYVRMQDLQSEFTSPSVMDIKMGVRTYLEKELAKAEKEPTLRKDLYGKMVTVDPEAPTAEEKENGAVTKTRYLKFRDDMSSSSLLGFRIEGIKTPAIASKDYKKTRTRDDVQKALSTFVGDNSTALEQYASLLQDIRNEQKPSPFFRSHEMVGSSLLFLHDSSGKAGVWMIDFAKCSSLPSKVTVDHTSPWHPGNYEDGYWTGLDNLADIFQQIVTEKQTEK